MAPHPVVVVRKPRRSERLASLRHQLNRTTMSGSWRQRRRSIRFAADTRRAQRCGTPRLLQYTAVETVAPTIGDRQTIVEVAGAGSHRQWSRFRSSRPSQFAGTVVLLALLVGTEPVSDGIQLRSAVRCVLPRLDKSVVCVAGHDVDVQMEHVLPPCRAVRLEER